MKFHIIIPIHNRLELTRKCLVSLAEQTYRDFLVYIIDDGSVDGSSEIIQNEFGKSVPFKMIKGDGNLWWAGSIKKGVEIALPSCEPNDYIVTLNNDVTVDVDFLSRAELILREQPLSMIGGISIDSIDKLSIAKTGWKMVCWPLAITRRIWWPGTIESLSEKPPFIEIDFLPGTATFVPYSIAQRFGTVNPDILPHYHADSEYSYRLKRKGVPVLLSRDLHVYHDQEATGLLSNTKSHPTLLELLQSFTSIKSGNCLRYKWNFAKACCPPLAIVPFFIFDTIKVIIRSLGIMMFGERIEDLKSFINH